jgi:hypothetical protein
MEGQDQYVSSHPAATLFPLMSDAELEPLVASMREGGFDPESPVLRYRGQVLDGRNRLRAAEIAGVAPAYRDLPDDCDPYIESWKHNGARRHLPPSQIAAIGVLVFEQSTAWQHEREERRMAANGARAEKAKAQHAVSNPRNGESSGRASDEAPPESRTDVGKTAKLIAAHAGVSRSTVERMQKLAKEDPQKLLSIAHGEKAERAPVRPRIDREQRRADVQRLHDQGLGTMAIARALKLDSATVSAVKVELGVGATVPSCRLWRDIQHATASVSGAGQRFEELATRLEKQDIQATAKEVEQCQKSLSKTVRQIRLLLGALQKAELLPGSTNSEPIQVEG